MSKRWIVIGIIVASFIAFLVWLFAVSSKPLPGEQALQPGRNHLEEGSKIDYKFNPPTSGDHYPSWITKGFYDSPRPDGNLVHSQEHGYIIIWYDCEKMVHGSLFMVKSAYAQGIGMTFGSEGSSSASLESMPKAFSDGSCDSLKTGIKNIINKYGPHKLIAVPRVGMDHKIIVTAWGRMMKLDLLDENLIKEFINDFRDAGPEHTDEP